MTATASMERTAPRVVSLTSKAVPPPRTHYPDNTTAEVAWAMSSIRAMVKQLPYETISGTTTLGWSTTIPGWPHGSPPDDPHILDRIDRFLGDHGVFAENPHAAKTVAKLGPAEIARYWFPRVEQKKSDILVIYNLVWWLYDDSVETCSDAEQARAIAATVGDLTDPADEPRSVLRAFNALGQAFGTMPTSWKDLLHRAQSDWFASHGRELDLIRRMEEAGRHPDCETFLTWRYVNIAAFALAVLTDYAMSAPLDEQRWSTHIDSIRTQFNWMCILQNDMTSMHCGKDGARLNMTKALCAEFDIDVAAAFHIMTRLHEQCVGKLSAACTQFAHDADYDPPVMEWIALNVDLARGLAIFHATALRYGDC